MIKIKHIIWDWNGTLVNDAQLCVDIVNEILSEFDIPPVSFEFYRNNFSFPVRNYYDRLGLPKNEKSYRRVSEIFISEYRKRWESCDMQPNAYETMNRVRDAGISQSVLSASKFADLVKFVDGFGLSDLLETLSGTSNVQAAGKKDISTSHLSKISADPESTLLVGDTVHDFEVSNFLGTHCVLFSGGHNSSKVLKQSGCEAVVEDLLRVFDRVID